MWSDSLAVLSYHGLLLTLFLHHRKSCSVELAPVCSWAVSESVQLLSCCPRANRHEALGLPGLSLSLGTQLPTADSFSSLLAC